MRALLTIASRSHAGGSGFRRDLPILGRQNASAALAADGPPERPDTRQVMFVGNNWDGTADIVDARTFKRLARINTIPDKHERMREIRRDPERLAFFLAIRQFVGEGNDQYTDDMFTTHDGTLVAVSRPSFAAPSSLRSYTKPERARGGFARGV